LASVRHPNEGAPPQARRARKMRLGAAGLGFATMVGAAFESAVHPSFKRMVARCKGENQDGDRAVRRAGVVGLGGIENAAVGRIEARLSQSANGAGCGEEGR